MSKLSARFNNALTMLSCKYNTLREVKAYVADATGYKMTSRTFSDAYGEVLALRNAAMETEYAEENAAVECFDDAGSFTAPAVVVESFADDQKEVDDIFNSQIVDTYSDAGVMTFSVNNYIICGDDSYQKAIVDKVFEATILINEHFAGSEAVYIGNGMHMITKPSDQYMEQRQAEIDAIFNKHTELFSDRRIDRRADITPICLSFQSQVVDKLFSASEKVGDDFNRSLSVRLFNDVGQTATQRGSVRDVNNQCEQRRVDTVFDAAIEFVSSIAKACGLADRTIACQKLSNVVGEKLAISAMREASINLVG